MSRIRSITVFLAALLLTACATVPGGERPVTISIVGINDIHGQLLPDGERHGFVSISAYVGALRELRRLDGGEVLVIDAGDMWQGTLESNLQEGAPMIEAYNAVGVAAAAIGNHEFDFGPVGPDSTPASAGQDPRGALRKRAREAAFPLLTANLIDESTGLPVDWDNVYPSVMLEVAGLKVGVVGVMTEHALVTTIAPNTVGLRVASLTDAIVREATRLRSEGASLVIVAAHAGSECREFGRPYDTSSCNMHGEIMRVARELPAGLVDHIVAGHVHKGIAHVVNDIAITSGYASGRAFGRVDFVLGRDSGEVLSRRVHPPQYPTAGLDPRGRRYEGQPLEVLPQLDALAREAVAVANARKQEKLGVTMSGPFELVPDVESALGNLMTTAMLDSFDADIAIHNVIGGIRNGLPAGDLTYGDVYEMFPFDNVVTIHNISGLELRAIVARKVAAYRKPGFAGMRVFARCDDGRLDVTMRLDDGREIADDDRVRMIANDFLAFGGDDILTPVVPEDGYELSYDLPKTRDALIAWFRRQAGTLDPDAFRSHSEPTWNVSPGVRDCRPQMENTT